MPKRIANALTLLSAVVCVGSAMVVGRSLFRYDAVVIPMDPDTSLGVGAIDATVIVWLGLGTGRVVRFSLSIGNSRAGFDTVWQTLTGIRWLGIGWGIYGGHFILILPLWLVPIVTAVAPARWWRARRRGAGRGFPVEGAALAG